MLQFYIYDINWNISTHIFLCARFFRGRRKACWSCCQIKRSSAPLPRHPRLWRRSKLSLRTCRKEPWHLTFLCKTQQQCPVETTAGPGPVLWRQRHLHLHHQPQHHHQIPMLYAGVTARKTPPLLLHHRGNRAPRSCPCSMTDGQ